MKKITLLFLVFTIVIGTAVAQNADSKWAIGLGPGIDYNLETENINALANIYLSRYLSPSFDVMLDYRQVFFKSETEDAVVTDLVNPLLNLRFKFNNGSLIPADAMVQPYLFAGVGYLWDNEADGVNFDAGVGFKFPVSPNTSIYLNGAFIKGIDGEGADVGIGGTPPTVNEDHFQVTGLIEFAFGAKDSDGDGVKDPKDECPDTPAGVAVDDKGCPLDGDGDGVPDYQDECPDEAGSARFNGCPDTDGDGIPDKDDDCPEEAGLAKFNGCPDSDEDGVIDSKDLCPDTPKGCPVDENGCPLDTDGDGVIDCEDNCPREKGPASNNGCPDWVDVEVPAKHFAFDSYELTDEVKAELDKIADQLNSSKEYQVVVAGHTCNIGTEEYNMELSEKRAQEVVKYLLKKGVNNAYIASENYGETRPAVENTYSQRKFNRRVEFEVMKIRK